MRAIFLAIHILGGSVGILSGFVAMFAPKGATLHRRSGMLFVVSMLVMAFGGLVLAVGWHVVPESNVASALLAVYFVGTSLTTVRPETPSSRRLDIALMLIALVVALDLFGFGVKTYFTPGHRLHGMPMPPFFIFGTVALLSALADVRLIRAGGSHTLRGPRRLTRHLWRMSFTLLLAAFSFFLGQAKVIPKPIRIVPLLMIPPLVVLGAMLYWLWRIRLRRKLRGVIVADLARAA